ncbi:Long-chain-fatty-acid--CoA ligase 4, partial [Cichlidogyrus casuarinus]
YGLTETFSSGCIMETGDMRTKHVGAPLGTVEIILRPWEEGSYFPTDQPNPRGEVLIGGDPVSRGYFKQPELTAKDFFTNKDGRRFFCTGDIGQFNADGTLSIIDRKKDLVKLQAGEYVSLAKVELALGQSLYVENACCYASPDHTFTVCFVSPKKKQLRDLAIKMQVMPSEDKIAELCKKESISEENALHQLLCETDKVKQGVLADLHAMCKEAALATFEIPKKVHLDPAIWTPESGLVTDAMKLKRFNLQKKFQEAIDKMYA